MNQVTFPDVHVQLSGQDGNAFMIIGRVRSAMKQAGLSHRALEAFTEKAFDSASYEDLLRFVMETVDVS